MENLNIKDYLYHGIIDWVNYDNGKSRENLCLDKLESVLKCRYIYRPCDFKKYGITHRNTANLYTHFFTFVSCHPESIYASRFKKDIKEDNGYMVSTEYSSLGILLNPKLLSELKISDFTFCDKEIVIEENISLDEYAIGIYINPTKINDTTFDTIKRLIQNYGYEFNIYNIFDGSIIWQFNDEKEKVKIY